MAKKKQKRNISGLRNQPKIPSRSFPDDSLSNNLGTPAYLTPERPHVSTDPDESDDEAHMGKELDSLKPCWEDVDEDDEGMESIGEKEEYMIDNWEDLEKDGLYVHLKLVAKANRDDFNDDDWIPQALRRRRALKRARPLTYIKGPDVGSKSERTQKRYAKLLKDQKKLDMFGFKPVQKSVSRAATSRNENSHCSHDSANLTLDVGLPGNHDVIDITSSEPEHGSTIDESLSDSEVEFLTFNDSDLAPLSPNSELLQIPAISSISPDSDTTPTSRKRPADSDLEDSATADDGGENAVDDEQLEDDLQETLTPHTTQVRDWRELKAQITADLKAKHARLSLREINQLLILQSFANLRLKGEGCIQASRSIASQWRENEGMDIYFARRIRALARHYQIFEQLPIEKRGGRKNMHSLLKNEEVKVAARAWLTGREIGSVTPRKFAHGLNETILPSLGITTQRPLCERTARRWLVKLGWMKTTLRKGVYMDGHERPDVVEYREKVFLPKMLEFERRMAKFEGTELKRIEPNLLPGERELIAEFQDETCFQQNDFQSSLWLRDGEQILQKKGRGRLIHISDFVEEVNGRLVVYNEDGSIRREARKIIHPGANGDPYWDCAQLIQQVKNLAIPVFEEAHPGCQALFIFDHSSAHAALADDALKAFEMNKGNGGKQRKQKNTIIPETNPYPEFRGKVQRMTTDDGQQKGLQQTLRERGFNISHMRAKCAPVCPFENSNCCMARLLSKQDDFINQISVLETVIKEAGHECLFLPKFHCELNPIEMYWGWAKYRYRQVPKMTFEDAKKATVEALNSCPTDVIRRFVNRTWRFMSAYRKGLKGKAAAWAVRKHKGHRTVSGRAMMHIESVLNT